MEPVAAVIPEAGPQSIAEKADFEAIAREARPAVLRFLAASVRNWDLAETLTQECLLKAFKAYGQFRGDASPRTWLMTIAANLARDYWRDRRLQFWKRAEASALDLSDASDLVASRESSAETQIAAREQLDAVWNAVEGLSQRQREVFLLRFVEELELAEIASVTGMPVGTVKSHLARALKAVRNEAKR